MQVSLQPRVSPKGSFEPNHDLLRDRTFSASVLRHLTVFFNESSVQRADVIIHLPFALIKCAFSQIKKAFITAQSSFRRPGSVYISCRCDQQSRTHLACLLKARSDTCEAQGLASLVRNGLISTVCTADDHSHPVASS